MNYKMLIAAALSLPAAVMAQAPESFADRYFTGNEGRAMSPEEQQALALSVKADQQYAVPPSIGNYGSIRWQYGSPRPTIVCAVLQICDVMLQAGEQVNSINLGDSVRWSVEPAVTGSGEDEVQHLIIKPLDVNLDTSLVVTTDRRSYHFKLLSTRDQYMPSVSFIYGDDASRKWDALKAKNAQTKANAPVPPPPPETGYLGSLSFDYSINGLPKLRPVRVYNDGRKTILEMPEEMQRTEAPTLLVVRREASTFQKEETVMVNYRVQGRRYIVDTVFDKAILISGVGKSQERVTITRKQ